MTGLLVSALLIAATPDVLWTSVGNGGVYSCVSPGDLDSDGVPDVVAGLYYSDPEPTLQAISGADGSIIWTSSDCQGIYQDEGLRAAPDLDGDGVNDVVLATPGGYAPPGRCAIAVSGATGATIWYWSAYLQGPNHGWGYGICPCEDITGDGVAEILAAFGGNSSNHDGTIVCLNGDSGDSLWTANGFGDASEDVQMYTDITGDDVPEIAVAIGGNSLASEQLWLLDGSDGSKIWSIDVGGDAMCVSLMDRSETMPAILVCTFDGTAACVDQSGYTLWFLDLGGMLLDIEGGPDINGDGFGEVAIAADNAGVTCRDGATGDSLWSYSSGASTWSATWADSVLVGASWVPCIAAGSVNGYKAVLVDATSGDQVWEQSVGERVYGVSVVPALGGAASQVVMASLQDQTSTPEHAWALGTPATSCPDDPPSTAGGIHVVSPCRGAIPIQLPEGEWNCWLYDISGRLIMATSLSGATRMDANGLTRGLYLLRAERDGVELRANVMLIE